jgi:hypothetical protein
VFFPYCQTASFTKHHAKSQFCIVECSYYCKQTGRRESMNWISVGMFWVGSVCSSSSCMQLHLDPKPIL